MRFLDACSGISAASVAWKPLGWTCAGFSEIDPFACAVLAHHYPEVTNYGDITTADFRCVGPVDVLVGGTPCQGFSVAGRGAGMDDPRSRLALRFLDVAAECGAKWIVWENVFALTNKRHRRDFLGFLREMRVRGYSLAWRILDARYWGVAQQRRRVFVVGHLGDDWRPPAAVLFDAGSLRGDSAPGTTARTHVAALTACGVGTCGADDGQAQAGHLIAFDPMQITSAANRANPKPGDPCHTLHQRGAGMIAHTLRGDGFDASEDGTGRGTLIVFQTRIGRNGRGQPKAICDALTSSEGGSHTDSKPHVAYYDTVRRITPMEAERLMNVPDGYTLVPYRGKPAKDSPRYRALGNSIVTTVLRWLGERIEAVERGNYAVG